ncbi:MAG: hypothetical protein JKX84_08040, partial [Flavobacteriales bacterium]|nr:hypothetical protein [Flavobacteriales bacterium]
MFRSLFFAALFFVNATWAQQLHFSGTISGFADENLLVEYPSDRFGDTWKDEIAITGNSFSKKIDLPNSGWLKLSYKDKDRKIYVWNNSDSLHISFEADFLDDELKIAGTSGNIQAFTESISEKYASRLTIEWLSEQAKDATNIDAMEMDAFRLRNDVVSALEKFESSLPKMFVWELKNHLGYYYYLSLFKFSSVKTSRSSIPKATEIPKVLLEGLDWKR